MLTATVNKNKDGQSKNGMDALYFDFHDGMETVACERLMFLYH